jgi:hypothetical protein
MRTHGRNALRALLAAGLGLMLAACPPTDPGQTGTCEGITLNHVTPTSNAHVGSDCSVSSCGNGVNPPTGGPHCNFPLACRNYDTAQQRCAWIHNLEHGHMVLAYNCPGGCPDVVAALEEIRDSSVLSGGARRILITPDPLLPARVAAIVWGWSYVSDEVNADAIRCLQLHQDEEAPEAGLNCAQ